MSDIDLTPTSSNPAARFENVGDTVTGTVTSAQGDKYETEFGSGAPFADDPSHPDVKKFRNGNPRPLWIIDLDTSDGPVTVWANWRIIDAIKQAAREAQVTGLVGNKLTVKYADQEATTLGNPAKVYRAKLEAQAPKPADIDDLDAF